MYVCYLTDAQGWHVFDALFQDAADAETHCHYYKASSMKSIYWNID